MKLTKIGLSLTALIFVGGGVCFSQTTTNEQTMNNTNKQEARIAILKQKIAEAGDDFVSFSEADYDLLLSQPLESIGGFTPLATTAGGIMLGIRYPEDSEGYKTHLQIVFPYIPNISEGEVFVYFDYVKGTNGHDYLDRHGNTEIKDDGTYAENDFTQVTLDVQTGNSKPFYFGGRYVNLRDPEDDMTIGLIGALGGEVELSAVSGKVVMLLPTNITGLTLTKDDIGIEKPFAGGVVTLIEINDDNLSFHFYKSNKDFYTLTVFDDYQNQLDIGDISEDNGLYQVPVEHAQTLKLYQADIIRKEFPFSFEIKGQSVSEQTPAVEEETKAENKQPDVPAPVYLDKNDPIFLNIQSRAFSDLDTTVKGMGPESAESKLAETLSKEKNSELAAILGESINNYARQTQVDAITFWLLNSTMVDQDQKKLKKKWEVRVQTWEVRVQSAGADKYVAEFWEDGLVVNSEENAMAYAQELANSNLFKEDPNYYIENVEDIKNNYADILKNIKAGKQERYLKMMALLYSLDEGGTVSFINPLQPVIDFLKN
jgi:hypothetical protein